MRVTGFHGGAALGNPHAMMNNFGSIGVNPTAFAWYEVYAVDPNDATHIIAADALNNDVKVSTTGGDDWREIPGLTEMVTHHGAFLIGEPAGDRTVSLVSAISFCPDNPNRVLLGTQQGGAYLSIDGGSTSGAGNRLCGESSIRPRFFGWMVATARGRQPMGAACGKSRYCMGPRLRPRDRLATACI